MSIHSKRNSLRPRRFGAVVLAMLCAVSLAACSSGGAGEGGDSAKAAAAGPIKIALLLSLSGLVTQPHWKDAGVLREKEINSAGGINGQKIELTVYDIGTDPQTAINATNQAVRDQNLIAVGNGITSLVKTTQPILDRANIPLLYMANTAELSFNVSGFNKIFAITPTTQAQQGAGVAYMKDVLKVKTVAVTGTNDAGSVASGGFGKASLKESGLTIHSDQLVAPTVTDMTPQILNIKGADAILENGYPNIDTILIRNARQNGLDIPIFTSIGGAAQVTNKLTPADGLKDVYVLAVCGADVPLENQTKEGTTKTFLQNFATEFGADANKGTAAGSMYDGVSIAAEAVKAVGSDRDKLTTYFRSSVDLKDGVCGSYRSDEKTQVLASANNAFVLTAVGGQLKRASE